MHCFYQRNFRSSLAASVLAVSFFLLGFNSTAQFKLVEEENLVKVVYGYLPGTSINSELKVYLEGSDKAILGQLAETANKLFFTPLVPFKKDINYVAVYLEDKFHFHLIDDNQENFEVLAVYPSPDTLPSNLLKFYILFSEPVGLNQAYDAIQLYNEKNELMIEAFVNLSLELWNEDRTRLTLWLDPGRIKRNLLRNQMEGEVLEVGKYYRLEISERLRNANGLKLPKNYSKEFLSTDPDRSKPVAKDWELQVLSGKLILNFYEVMDYGTALKMMQVENERSEEIRGDWRLGEFEMQATFEPERPFTKGVYRLKVNSLIEDWAANNLMAPFDREIGKEERFEMEFEYIDFEID